MLRLAWSKDRELMQVKMDPLFVPLPEDAIEIGYEIGRSLHLAGAGKLQENRKLGRWLGDKVEDPGFAFWKRGFRAGYRGLPKPR